MRKNSAGRLVLTAAVAINALSVCLGCLERFGISGGDVTLEAKVNAGDNLSEITWKKGKDLVAELGLELWIAPRFQGKVELDSVKGSLTLRKLQQDDSGDYTAEVLLGSTYQIVDFCLRILEHPRPPQLNCTVMGDGIQVSCELDAQYATENLSLTYSWKYQESNQEIPGNSSKICLEKDVDLSENITCDIRVLDATTSSSISLRGCTPTEIGAPFSSHTTDPRMIWEKGAAPQIRNRALLWIPFVVLPCVGMAFCLWKRGFCNFRSNFRSNFKRKGKSQECEDGTDTAEASPREPCLREEPPGNLEENSSKGPSDPAGT